MNPAHAIADAITEGIFSKVPSHTHPDSSGGKLTIKLLRFLPMRQSSFGELPRVGVHVRNLLKPRVVITSYNHHVRLLSPGPLLVGTTKVYPALGADILMESITLV